MQSFDKIVCIGKNYLDHAKELGDAIPDKPVIFLKPPSVLKQASHWGESLSLKLPHSTSDVHYECEIVLRLKKGGYQMSLAEAKTAVGGVSLGLDMTLRTLQATLKKNGHPWTTAKVFIDSAIVGPWIPLNEFQNFMETEFSLTINDQIKQHALPKQMLFNPFELIAYVSEFFPLCEGDLIYTGTPAGVGAVEVNTTATLKWGNHQYSTKW
jgi:2-keto-4-pentenoate hydratase/2-oxohepta-3-ene-1,7-dioic acid hydratase in catechol pathway